MKKLDDNDVALIVDDAMMGLNANVIAERHSLASSTVQRIIREVKGLKPPTRGVRHYLRRPDANTLKGFSVPSRPGQKQLASNNNIDHIHKLAKQNLDMSSHKAVRAQSELMALEGKLVEIDDLLNSIIDKIVRING